eukprot:scaffold837_cov255-Pinguiococcus_pyrenoidosus.AAC.9
MMRPTLAHAQLRCRRSKAFLSCAWSLVIWTVHPEAYSRRIRMIMNHTGPGGTHPLFVCCTTGIQWKQVMPDARLRRGGLQQPTWTLHGDYPATLQTSSQKRATL